MKQKIIKAVILCLSACFMLMPAAAGAAAGTQAQKPGTSQKDRISHDSGKHAARKGKKAATSARTRAPSERIKADQAVDFPTDI